MIMDLLSEFFTTTNVGGGNTTGVLVKDGNARNAASAGVIDITSANPDNKGIVGVGQTNDAHDLGTGTCLYWNTKFAGTVPANISNLELVLTTSDTLAEVGTPAADVIISTGVFNADRLADFDNNISIPMPSHSGYKRYIGVMAVRTDTVSPLNASSDMNIQPISRKAYPDAKRTATFNGATTT